jgi:hypothetical protein
METDPVVMAQLGGPVSSEEIPALHRRRLSGLANDPWWLVIVTDDGESAGRSASGRRCASTTGC